VLVTRVGTYVQRGSKFCFVVVLLVLADTLIKILNYFPISPCFQHIAPLPCSPALPGHLARQPYPAALPGNLVDLVALHGSLARQCCTASLPGSLAEILQV
jgi:hypothetical protein